MVRISRRDFRRETDHANGAADSGSWGPRFDGMGMRRIDDTERQGEEAVLFFEVERLE